MIPFMPAHRNHGFTIVELIVTIVIISILAFVFITKFSFAPSSLTAAREKMISDIRYAQSLAVNRGGRYGVEFQPGTDKYSVYINSPATKIKDPAHLTSDLIVDYPNDKKFSNIDLVSANFDGSTSLEFDWRGIPHSGAGSPLVSEGTVVISNPSGSTTIRITPQTGRIYY